MRQRSPAPVRVHETVTVGAECAAMRKLMQRFERNGPRTVGDLYSVVTSVCAAEAAARPLRMALKNVRGACHQKSTYKTGEPFSLRLLF